MRPVERDILIIGGGFYGCMIALELQRLGIGRVVVVEKERDILQRASFINQARVHNGYHYPRSLPTGLVSRRYYRRFCEDFDFAIYRGMEKYYAIACESKVTSGQFERFCHQMGAPIFPVTGRPVNRLFNEATIEAVYRVEEAVFDAKILASHLRQRIQTEGVELMLESTAIVRGGNDSSAIAEVNGKVWKVGWVFNCTYAAIDQTGIAIRSNVKREWTEIALIKPPPELQGLGITVMDGAFFSTMPFPATGLYSLTHVRYTPVAAWTRAAEQPQELRTGIGAPLRAHAMVRDGSKYLPVIRKAEIACSLFDIKAVMTANEDNDGRPILYEVSDISPRIISILGGKIDNIYDVLSRVRQEVGLSPDAKPLAE